MRRHLYCDGFFDAFFSSLNIRTFYWFEQIVLQTFLFRFLRFYESKIPIVHGSVLSGMQTTNTASSIFPSMSITISLNLTKSSGLICSPQKPSYSHDLPLFLPSKPTISTSFVIPFPVQLELKWLATKIVHMGVLNYEAFWLTGFTVGTCANIQLLHELFTLSTSILVTSINPRQQV